MNKVSLTIGDTASIVLGRITGDIFGDPTCVVADPEEIRLPRAQEDHDTQTIEGSSAEMA